MIYVTGDTHGDPARFAGNAMGDAGWSAEDTLIVCGDFGFVFREDARERAALDALAAKPYTIAFCDGNHENFDALYRFPEERWQGGRVHRIRRNVLHLMRGQVFTLEGRRLFTMGGAYSIDRYLRRQGVSYWSRELPDGAEYREAAANLQAAGFAVDAVITHTAPRELIRWMGKSPDPHDMELTGFLEWVMAETRFDRWFFGHWHLDRTFAQRFTAVYEAVHTL